MTFEERHKKIKEDIDRLSKLSIQNQTQIEEKEKNLDIIKGEMKEIGVSPVTIVAEKERLAAEIEKETASLEEAINKIKMEVF